MRIQHAFRVAGGAGGVAHRRGAIFIEQRPLELLHLLSQQLVIAAQVGNLERGHVRPVAEGNEGLDVRQFRREFLDQGGEARVEEQVLVFAMVGDELDLLREQTRVDGVQHGAHAGYAEIQLHVPVAVPGQGADALAGLHAEGGQGIGKLFGALADVRIGATVDVALHSA
ncbi:hypothetical protein D3C84_102770 [compost metagenome]